MIWHFGYMFRLYAVMDIMHVKIIGMCFIHQTINKVRLTNIFEQKSKWWVDLWTCTRSGWLSLVIYAIILKTLVLQT